MRLVLLAAAAALLQPAFAEPTVKLSPKIIRMGTFYSGEWMRISGAVSPGSDVIVVLRGPRTEEVFNHKGRVGPIWANTGRVHISAVPSLFLCYSSRSVETLLHRDEIERRQLDDRAILRQMEVSPKSLDREEVREDFIDLKKQENIYREIVGGARLGAPGPDGVPYSVELHWPRKAPPASYDIRVYECRNGLLVGRTTAVLPVVKIGFPAAMGDLAARHASLYGIAAVLIAAIGGFGIDFLFAFVRRRMRPREVPSGEAAEAKAGRAKPLAQSHGHRR